MPLGFTKPNGREATVRDLLEWKEKEKPNAIQQTSYLTLGGFVASAVGGILAFLGGKNNSGGLFGGFLGLVGLAATAIGYYFSQGIYSVTKSLENKSQKPIQELITELRNKDFKAEHRVKVIKDINTYTNKKDAKDVLIECLNDPSKQVREAAIDVLHDIVSVTDLANLIRPLNNQTTAGANTEHEEKKKDVVKLLTKCLKDIKDKDAHKVRLEAIDALVKLKEDSALKLFFELLNNPNENKEVKTKLLEALGSLATKDTKIGKKLIQTCLKELHDAEQDNDLKSSVNSLLTQFHR